MENDQWPRNLISISLVQKQNSPSLSTIFYTILSNLTLPSATLFLINGCWNSLSVLNLLAGSSCRHLLAKSASSGETFYRTGGGLTATILIIYYCESIFMGASPWTSSNNMIPNAQISTFSVYYWSLANSGAIQAGVPTLSFSFGFFFVKTVASPKSPILICPSLLNKILSVFRSRCTSPFTCMALSPMRTFSII